MRIGRVAIENLGPYEAAEVILDQPMSICLAANTGGKSTLAEAIQLSTTFRSPATSADGKGADEAIRVGAKKAELTLGLETSKGVVELVTKYGPGRTQIVRMGQGDDSPATKKMQDGFASWLERNRDAFSCCCDSQFFIREKPADQKDILANLVLPTSHDFPAALRELAEKHVSGIDWKKKPVEIIDWIYGDNKRGAYASRTQAKANLNAIHIPATPSDPEYDSETVQTKLADLRAKQTKEAKKVKQGGTVQVGRIEQQIEQKEREKAQTAERLIAARTERDKLEKQILSAEKLAKIKDQTANRKRYNELDAEIQQAKRDADDEEAAAGIYQQLKKSPYCPTCTQAVTVEFLDGKIDEHAQGRAEALKRIEQAQDEQKKLGDIAGAERQLAENEQLSQKKLAQVSAVAQATDAITALDNAIAQLNRELESAKAQESAPIDTSALDSLNAEIQQWEARLAPAVQYESTLKQIERAKSDWQDANTKVGELEKLCAEFGPKGIKAKLIDEHIGGFESCMNEVLKAWGYVARLSIDPYAFDVMTPKTSPMYLPLRRLSGFEQLAFGVALQCAVAVYSKLKLVVIDKADTMVGAQRNRLFGCVKAMLDAGTLEQALVLVADESKEPPKAKAGVGYYQIRDGKITKL